MHQANWAFVKRYTENYLAKFNELRSQLARIGPYGELYSRQLVRASVFVAKDGIAIFYFVDPPGGNLFHSLPFGMNQETLLHEGASIFENQDVSLSYILQYLTHNSIKILGLPTQQMREDNWQAEMEKQVPADIPLQEIATTTINKGFLQAAIALGKDIVFPNIATGPILDYKEGYVKALIPTRRHFFSPIMTLQKELFLLFAWPALDVFWKPQELGIDAEAGATYAEADIRVLMQGIETGMEVQTLPLSSFSDFDKDPYLTVSNRLLAVCHEFERLINEQQTVESDVQDFLEKKDHRFIVSPIHKEIIPQKRIGNGKYIVDFAVLRSDGDYHLIEIENPNTEIYTSTREEPAAILNHAINQVQDWLRYIEDNRDSVRREDGLLTIYKPSGEVIVGRDAHFQPLARRRFDYKRAESAITIRTYDMILAEARTYAEGLKQMSAHIPD